MSGASSRVEAITKIVGNLRRLNPAASTEGLFVRDRASDLDLLIRWTDFTLNQLSQVKRELRRGDDFTIGERRYIDADDKLVKVIGVAFASGEFLPKYGLEMHPDGHVTPLKQ